MMLVRNYVDRSGIHGMGIFAGEFIPKGTMVWEFTEGCDQVYSQALLARLLPIQREIVLFYGYVEPGMSDVILCCDNARHFNYAVDPNCGPGGEMKAGTISTFAMRDIAPGEELTFSVEEDADALRKLGPELYRSLLPR
jgi:hypothetical protein